VRAASGASENSPGSRVKRPLIAAIVTALSLSGGGCALTFDTSHLGVAVTMAEPAAAPPAGSTFHITKHPVYLLMGLITVSEPNLEDILAGQLGAGAGVAGLRIHVRSRLTDLIVTGLTLGLITPRSVTYEGVIVNR